MSAPNPIDNEELFECIVLGGKKSPGKVTLSGHDRKVNWDVKSGNGQSGASTTLKDIPPIEFTASFYLVKDISQGIDDFAEWPAFQEVIESTVNGAKPTAIDVYHPDLASQNPPIKSVCKAMVGGAVDDGKGGRTITVKLQEYAPPKPAGGSPNGSSSKTKKASEDPDAAALAQLNQLTNQYQNTPWS